MKKIDTLWPERRQAFHKEMQRYLKYMFNDHLRIVLIFGGGAIIYYYSQWVNTLSSKFPIASVMAIVLAFILTISPIITLLKEADVVFLLPLEEKLSTYFNKGMRFSFTIQAFILLASLGAFMPMYARVKGAGFQSFLFLLAILLIIKYWNIRLHWDMLKIAGQEYAWTGQLVRFFMNATFIYFLIDGASLYFIASAILIMLAFTFYVRGIVKGQPIKWEVLIDKEQGRMQMFYRAANMFTDVPQLKGQVKRRRWLDPLFSAIPFDKRYTYRFLYMRTLIRTTEYSGLVVRLTAIAALLVFFNSNLYASIGLSVLFIYLTGFQLLPLLSHHDLKVWPSLYPLERSLKKQAFLQLLLKLLIFQSLFFGLMTIIQGAYVHAIWISLIGLLFAFVFVKGYVAKRMKKNDLY